MNPASNHQLLHRLRGFTLIELMVTVVVLAVLAAIAIPSYEQITRRARRSEARAAVADAANREEQFFNDNKSYADHTTDLGVAATTENSYYTIAVTTTVNAFTVTATARAQQTADTKCRTFSIDELGTKSATNASSDDSTDTCW